MVRPDHQLLEDSDALAPAGPRPAHLLDVKVLRHHRMRWKLLRKHDLLPMPAVMKCALAARHAAELAILGLVGSRYLAPEALDDKLRGRRKLLEEVWSGYGNS